MLIEKGEAVESVLKKTISEDDDLIKEDALAIKKFLEDQESRGGFFSKMILSERQKLNEKSQKENNFVQNNVNENGNFYKGVSGSEWTNT